MSLENCKECFKLYNKLTYNELCPECADAEFNDYEIVKDYLEKNGVTSIDELNEILGVSKKRLVKFAFHSLLHGEIKYPCFCCGELITTGKVCRRCMDVFQEDLSYSKLENPGGYHLVGSLVSSRYSKSKE